MPVQQNCLEQTKTLSFEDSIAFRNGTWIPCKDLSWSVTDIATTHGVMLVERLRTAGGRLFDCDLHLDRLMISASLVGLQCNSLFDSLQASIDELLLKNHQLVHQFGDAGVVVLLSPGDPGHSRNSVHPPTVMMHLTSIPFAQLAAWYQLGCRLHTSSTRNVPAECWSPWIKTRSRLQYYLADHPPQTRTNLPPHSISANSIAVLLSTTGLVTETSVSNLLILDSTGRLISPSKHNILQGVSLHNVEKIAKELGFTVYYEDLSPDDFKNAKEILMTGTTGFVWSAIEFDGHTIGEGFPGELCKTIQATWSEKIGIDFVKQAISKAK